MVGEEVAEGVAAGRAEALLMVCHRGPPRSGPTARRQHMEAFAGDAHGTASSLANCTPPRLEQDERVSRHPRDVALQRFPVFTRIY